jgi:hypothetical protein
MNTYANKPMPYGVKERKLFRRQFYLTEDDFNLLIIKCEDENYTVRQAICFIDAWGEWLDG